MEETHRVVEELRKDGNKINTFEIHDMDSETTKTHSTPTTYSKVLRSLRQTIFECKQSESGLKTLASSLLYGLLVAYFGWATHYFVHYTSATLESTTCSGYGFLMILFIFFNFVIFYNLVIKVYFKPILHELTESAVGKTIKSKLKNRLNKVCLYLVVLLVILAYVIYDSRHNFNRLIPLSGLAIFLILGYTISTNKKKIDWHPVIWGLIIQFLFGLLTIRWETGRNVFECLGNKTTAFLDYAKYGAAFVYDDFLIFEKHIFIFEALSTVYFLSLIINVLYHYGIMQKVVAVIGEFLAGVMGTSVCESVNSAANIFLGMSEAPLLLKPYLQSLTDSELHSIMAAGFASVSGSVLAAYISFGANASHLITASVMSAPAALCYSKLTYPETEKTTSITKESVDLVKSEYSSALDAASKGALQATDVVLGIAANLIAFIAVVYFLNGVILWMGELVGYTGESAWSIELFAGYFFMPVSFIMGVQWEECGLVGKLIGIKTIINEFAAYKEMGTMILTPRTKLIATYAICGFSNPGSVGIMISTLCVLIPAKRNAIINNVTRAFFCGIIVCFMTACIAAILVP